MLPRPGRYARDVTSEHEDYSSTPLWRKIGITAAARVYVTAAPADLALDTLAPLPPGVKFLARPGRDLDVILAFMTRRAGLTRRFPVLERSVGVSGRLWIAWPKKAARMDTDLDFENVQAMGLDAGLVDNKSASITEAYQGLQFVRRVADRPRS